MDRLVTLYTQFLPRPDKKELNVNAKGQLISKCPFGVFKLIKKTNKFFVKISALASKKKSNQKNKGTLYH